MSRLWDGAESGALLEHPHQRHDPLLDAWVTVSPQRTQRPWLGAQDAPAPAPPPYDPACYLCPGNERAAGRRNPAYEAAWWFENDFPALDPHAVASPGPPPGGHGPALFRTRSAGGVCRVVCFSPRHDLHLAALPEAAVEQVVELWTAQSQELLTRPGIGHVQIFENRGSLMGASNPHPHSQIWADAATPTLPAREQRSFEDWAGDCLLCDYVAAELADGSRVVFVEGEVAVLVPFWATWPFETLLAPCSHAADLAALGGRRRQDWARAMRRLVTGYDRIFGVPFPYSMGIHQRGATAGRFHVHAHYYPPLLRSASVRKFMVGYEMLAQAQRDLSAETAAARLREVLS